MGSPLSSNILSNINTLPKFVTSAAQAIVTVSGNPSRIGVSGFIFDIIGVEEMGLESDITDHYTEDNNSIQDQIALRPEQFTLSGFVGELASNPGNPFTSILTTLQAFGPIPAMLTAFSIQAGQVYNRLATIATNGQDVINKAANIYTLFSDLSTTTDKQQNAFQYFYHLWLNRQLCEVETPWGIFEDMAILSIKARQDEDTSEISDFAVTFKRMRFASTTQLTLTGADLSSTTGRVTQVLQSTPDNSGSTAGVVTDSSLINKTASYLDN